MKLVNTAPTLRLALAAGAAAAIFGCAKKSSSPDPAPAPIVNPPATVAGPGNGTNPAPGTTSPAAPAQTVAALTTQILNKSDATAATTPAQLTLNFGVVGGATTQNISAFRFLCKLDTDTAFGPCSSSASHTFHGLTNGTQYTLSVHAVLIADASTVAADDSVTFTAHYPDAPAGNGGTPAAGGSGGTVVGGGSVVGGGTVVGGGAAPVSIAPQSMQIGSFYAFTVPADMHVTEFTTTKTYNGALSFYRISTKSDPAYLGNYACNGPFDTVIQSGDTSGNGYDYCSSTPSEKEYKSFMTNYSLANNHIEVATNLKTIDSENHVYIDINAFDSTFEYMQGRTRFEKLCLNSAVTASPNISMTFDFWGNPIFAQFVTCQAQIVAPTGLGLPTRDPVLWRNVWSIGSFMITSATLPLPDYHCFGNGAHPDSCVTANVHNASMLEVTMVTKTPYPQPAYFAHDAQQLFEQHLQRTAP